ncbi:MAG: SRPBCC family protein [Bacteroidota bacterium]
MNYSAEIIIELPRQKLVELFDNTENMYKWQEGLLSFDHLEGTPGHEGARSSLVYASRKGDLKMTGTIIRRNLPDEFHVLYEAKGVYNEIYNHFTENEPGKTTWRTVNVFRFRGLMALMALFMKSAFKSQTLLTMERFKIFAENNKQQ